MFRGDDTVFLIDFEWAGRVGEATFPENVCIQSFGPRSSKLIRPLYGIPKIFDWKCLADILSSLGCTQAAEHASSGELKGVETALLSAQSWKLPCERPNCLDFARLWMRFYSRKITSEVGRRRRAEEASLLPTASEEAEESALLNP